MRVLATSRFERDLKRATKRGKDLDKLWSVVEAVLSGCDLPARIRPHRLSGQWSAYWECHIEPDWLLIWGHRDEALVLVRTGTHADLFG